MSALFAREMLGSALFGFAVGYVAYRLLAGLDSYEVEILLTLALVMGGYAAARALHLSGPIAVVIAGMMIGNRGLPERSRERVGQFWELIDGIFNAVLFIVIGLELLRLDFHPTYAWAGVFAIPAVLAARFFSVGVAALIPGLREDFPPRVIAIRSLGVALSLPTSGARDAVITVTYGVVLFSILVQGLTLSRVLRRTAQ